MFRPHRLLASRLCAARPAGSPKARGELQARILVWREAAKAIGGLNHVEYVGGVGWTGLTPPGSRGKSGRAEARHRGQADPPGTAGTLPRSPPRSAPSWTSTRPVAALPSRLLWGCIPGRTGHPPESARSATDQNRVVAPQVLRQGAGFEATGVRPAATTSTTPLEVSCRSSPWALRRHVMRQLGDPRRTPADLI
jgi:hypothetical protein